MTNTKHMVIVDGKKEKKWYWEEVPFVPDGVKPEDMLLLPGHIFVKSTVVSDLMAERKFKEKRRGRNYEKKKGRKKGFVAWPEPEQNNFNKEMT